MKAYQVLAVTVGVILSATAIGHARQPVSATAKIDALPRDLEIQLALSALPRHLRDSATVYVLSPAKGFEVARKGTNGFHAFVARTGDDAFQGTWPLTAYRNDVLYPISFDAAGAAQNMRVFFDAAAEQAKGTPPEELKKLIQQRYATHYYKAPERAGVSYMMSPILRTYINPEHEELVATTSNPHVMYYVPNATGKDIGAATPPPDEIKNLIQRGHVVRNPDPMLIHQGPHGYMVQFIGVSDRESLRKEYAGMLDRICKIKKEWCLPPE